MKTQKPVWPTLGKARPMRLKPRALALFSHEALTGTGERVIQVRPINPAEASEVRFRNKAAFEYIVKNELWYTEGLRDAFTIGKPIVFPTDAIEIKANWVPITAAQKSRYHWNFDTNGKLYGLVALHISSKVLPNWFWATFEWVDNPGRSDYIGSRPIWRGLSADQPPPG